MNIKDIPSGHRAQLAGRLEHQARMLGVLAESMRLDAPKRTVAQAYELTTESARQLYEVASDIARYALEPKHCDCSQAGVWGATGRMPEGHTWQTTATGGYLAHVVA